MPHVETVQCARWTCVPQPEGALPHGGQSGNVAFRGSDALTTDKAASAMLTSATCKASTPLPKLSDICGTCESRFGADFSPLSSYRSPQAALKFSYRGDRVTRDGPLALRVPAAKNKTYFFCSGRAAPRASPWHDLRMRCAHSTTNASSASTFGAVSLQANNSRAEWNRGRSVWSERVAVSR